MRFWWKNIKKMNNDIHEIEICWKLSRFQNVQFCSRARKAKILTTGIHGVFRGLKFEPDTEIVQKGAFCKGLGLD